MWTAAAEPVYSPFGLDVAAGRDYKSANEMPAEHHTAHRVTSRAPRTQGPNERAAQGWVRNPDSGIRCSTVPTVPGPLQPFPTKSLRRLRGSEAQKFSNPQIPSISDPRRGDPATGMPEMGVVQATAVVVWNGEGKGRGRKRTKFVGCGSEERSVK
ncbi:hypothetical protein AXG93_2964s1230 [Marchantia polymorpha subsp. ruderalis]|uniref:Uncharacterized protein n=1 Tax=Marchantia polymorpha subsp. ruderalis TaxID=1480154 RepID=A0A176VM58_MARPO|nr:hypothetical protein AXG93_2964s1230 [Marchantia polymorpha subsp. ruderalis]